MFRCNPDGSDLEVFAYGLRNPQSLVFDQYGNLFTGDNNSDSGDQARWVYLVEGSDNGWRVGYQFMENPYSRGPYNAERLWYPPFEGQPAYIVPPVANIASGPSGVAYFPGTGLPARFKDHFFLVDFRGGGANSGVHSFGLKPKGAGFELVDREHFLWNILATDIRFGVDGGLYVSDWVEGWAPSGKGRLYRMHDPAVDKEPVVLETRRLLAEGMDKRSTGTLAHFLEHPDMRIRQEAQFALAERGLDAIGTLNSVARRDGNQLARLHAIWGLCQIGARYSEPAMPAQVSASLELLVRLLEDSDPEVRAQAAKTLGERRYAKAFDALRISLKDENSRVRFFAAIGLGRFGRADAMGALCEMLKENADRDPFLRHAGVIGLARIGDVAALLSYAHEESPAVRMGVLLALRRLQRPEIRLFLHDKNPALVLEAARAINDEPINGAVEDLADLIGGTELGRYMAGEPLGPSSVPKEAAPALGLEALLRRVLNANFHFGTPKTAQALAGFAANSAAPATMRVEALEELADWGHPAGIDRVIGLWRPVAAVRHDETAVEALDPQLSSLLRSAPDEVRSATLRCVKRLQMKSAGPLLSEIVADMRISTEVRVAALGCIATMELPSLRNALAIARKDPEEDLRRAATRWEGRLEAPAAVQRIGETLAHGTSREKQTALAALAMIPEPAADDVIGEWLDRLQAGKVPQELRLDVIEAANKRTSVALRKKLATYEASRPTGDPLAAYREELFGGTASEGRKIFFEKPEAQCVRCHKINGQGGDVGPDLSHVASQKDRQYLLESVVLPNKQIAPGFDSVMVIFKNGESQAGVLKSESETELVLNTPDTGPVSIKKSDIQSRRAALSPMPEGLGKILSREDLRSLVEFLSSLK